MASVTRPAPFVRVRAATAADLEGLAAVERSAAGAFRAIPALADLADGPTLPTEELALALEQGCLLVAVEEEGKEPQANEHVVGFLAARALDACLFVAEMSVARAAQGRGVGRALLVAAVELARGGSSSSSSSEGGGSRRFRAVTLTTYADVPWNGPFYASAGFAQVPAASLGDGHVEVFESETSEAGLARPGWERCCMVKWLA